LGIEKKFPEKQKSSQIFIVRHNVTGGAMGAHIIRETGLSLCVWGPTIQSNPYCICQFPNLINYYQQTFELSTVGWYHGWSSGLVNSWWISKILTNNP
jgi:hypothetical protein